MKSYPGMRGNTDKEEGKTERKRDAGNFLLYFLKSRHQFNEKKHFRNEKI